MTTTILETINLYFPADQIPLVFEQLSSITPAHVMAGSDFNLENTRMAILKLSRGNLQQVIYFTEKAKIDFRDVILWASQDNK